MSELGRVAYEAFAAQLAGTMTAPFWPELPADQRQAWNVAAGAVAEAVAAAEE